MSLEEYLDMQQAIGNELRVRILEHGVHERMREEWELLDAYAE